MTENVRDPKLPGGSLLSAYLDRQLMIWSDRGGASRHIGDRWADHCSAWLDTAIDKPWPTASGAAITITDILRLDEVEAVSREANLNQLENPDFLLIGAHEETPDTATIIAVDAKFAADRIKSSQVSAQVVENLISIPETGVTRNLVEETFRARGYTSSSIEDGSFLCPESTLTDFLLNRRTKGRSAAIQRMSIVRIDPAPGQMFADLPPTQLMPMLARQDQLPVSPQTNLLSALYYFRVACACVYLWQEQHQPLFTIEPASPPEIGRVSADVARLLPHTRSAYEVMLELVDEAEQVQRARQSIANVASLPIRMGELRALMQSVGKEGDKLALRQLRKELELEYRNQLYRRLGEIPADDPRPLGEILDAVASATRDLSSHMREFAVNHAQTIDSRLPVSRTS